MAAHATHPTLHDTPPIVFHLRPTRRQADGIVRPQSIDQAWLIGTCARLQQSGRLGDCRVVESDRLPERGIIVALINAIPKGIVATPDRLIVTVVADQRRRLWPGDVLVYQSPSPLRRPRLDDRLRHSVPGTRAVYMPHWPEPGLLPRDPARGDRVETVAFHGRTHELAPSLQEPAFAAAMAEAGLTWRINTDRRTWHDFRDVDVLLAMRRDDGRLVRHKPPSKLFNAWLAGVVPVLGPEGGYRREGRPGDNFVEVSTAGDALSALERLKADPRWRAGLLSARPVTDPADLVARITRRWERLFERIVIPAWHRLQSRRRRRSARLVHRAWATVAWHGAGFIEHTRNRIHRLAGIAPIR
jgi:hypothetical protein